MATFRDRKKSQSDFLGGFFEMAVGQVVDLFSKKRYCQYAVD